jgi:hypothetical protein
MLANQSARSPTTGMMMTHGHWIGCGAGGVALFLRQAVPIFFFFFFFFFFPRFFDGKFFLFLKKIILKIQNQFS